MAVAAAALVVSLLSFYFSIKSWREAHRPLVTARVTSFGMGGNVAIPLNLMVENTGNRPAKNIRLRVDTTTLDSLFIANNTNTLRKQVEACFSDEGEIPILANSKAVSNSFGVLSDDDNCTWKGRFRFEIVISYQDSDDRKFHHRMNLFTADDSGFAGGFWSGNEKHKA